MTRPAAPGKNDRSRSTREPARVIRLARRFSAPAERVFHAWLEPDVAGRWLFATALRPSHVDIDPRIGGSFRCAEQWDGRRTEHTGEYVEIVPHRRLVFTLAMAECPHVVTRVTAEISPRRKGCALALTHENVPRDCAGETEARWTGVLYGLDEALSSAPESRRAGRARVPGSNSGAADRPAAAKSFRRRTSDAGQAADHADRCADDRRYPAHDSARGDPESHGPRLP